MGAEVLVLFAQDVDRGATGLQLRRGDWKPVKQLGLDSADINEAYLQAIAWSRDYGAIQ